MLGAKRLTGQDPAHGGESGRRRGEKLAANRRAIAKWERKNPVQADPQSFEREIRPKLTGVSLAAMVRATGLSQPYCAMIRRGERVPHPRHWEALRGLRTEAVPEGRRTE